MYFFSRFFSVFILFFCFMENGRPGEPIIIAHRGESIFYPENTLAAFRPAKGKADMVEFDVRVTLDGELALLHDSTLNRTTNGDGLFSSTTLSMLKELDAGSWYHPVFTGEKIPTLEEALKTITPFAKSLVEHKTGNAAQYINLFNRLDMKNALILQSFDWDFIKDARKLDPNITLAALGSDELSTSTIQSIKDIGVNIIAWNFKSITQETCDLIHSFNMKLFVWTVDGPDIPVYVDMGVDGIITNDPGLTKGYIQSRKPGNLDLEKGLLAHWKLDEGARDPNSRIVYDLVGKNHGTLYASNPMNNWISSPESSFSGGIELNGDDEYILLPHNSGLDIGKNEMTISLWVKLNELPSEMKRPHAYILGSLEDSCSILMDKKSKEIIFKVTDVNNDFMKPGIPEAKLGKGKWSHIAGIYNGNAGKVLGQSLIFLDGKLIDVHAGRDTKEPPSGGANAIVKPGQTAAIGRKGTWSYGYFSGCVADIRLWNRALSFPEILETSRK
ncbi:hypothetical protein JW926_08710 [Candidatus Sumerlaeota bacterium]|nr:hypothetical protein [Candidatus Sumerlaeota bacterium]